MSICPPPGQFKGNAVKRKEKDGEETRELSTYDSHAPIAAREMTAAPLS